MPSPRGSADAGSARGRVDPEVWAGVEAYHALVGPGGLGAIADLGERREALSELMAAADAQPSPDLEREDRVVAGTDGAPDVRLRLYRLVAAEPERPAVLFIHGGGMNMGSIETEETLAEAVSLQTGFTTISVDYRLAPESPYPAQVEDCYAGLTWIVANATDVGIDADRLAIYGGSAGGGLAAATALMARDRGGPALRFQMLLYPMLDDRCETPSSHEIVDLGIWDRAANLEAWADLLGDADRLALPPYAVPARAEDLAGLPPTYIDVGGLDLFRDEAIEYAYRLMGCGVHTELHVYPGAVHSSEVFAPEADVSKRVTSYRLGALRRALAD